MGEWRRRPHSATARLRTLVPDLLEVSKCPDFVTDRGHTYGADLSDADKRALIAFIPTEPAPKSPLLFDLASPARD